MKRAIDPLRTVAPSVLGLGTIRGRIAALSLTAVAGCSALPTIVPDMAVYSSRPVRLESARGPLSARQSDAILTRLKNGGKETSIFERHVALEEGIAGSPLVVGNKVVLQLTNAYFVPDPQLLAALKDAAQRGVDVKIILPSTTDFALVFHAGRSHYGDLLRAGVKIYERREGLLHAKTALIDGVWSTIGSTNLEWRSFLHNDEVNAVILGQEFGAQMQTMFDADLAASDPVTLEKWKQRPLGNRVKEIAARVWQYWL